MAETAEESGKENYRSGRPPDGRNFSEADRGFPAAREATEKENTAAAGSGRPVGERFQRNAESPSRSIRNIGLAGAATCVWLLAPYPAWLGCIFQASYFFLLKVPIPCLLIFNMFINVRSRKEGLE